MSRTSRASRKDKRRKARKAKWERFQASQGKRFPGAELKTDWADAEGFGVFGSNDSPGQPLVHFGFATDLITKKADACAPDAGRHFGMTLKDLGLPIFGLTTSGMTSSIDIRSKR
jgi:hypothetical protein